MIKYNLWSERWVVSTQEDSEMGILVVLFPGAYNPDLYACGGF